MVHSGRPSLFTCLPKNAPTGALSRGPHGCGPRSRPALGHTQSGCCRRTRAAWTCLCPRLAPSPATRRLPQARHRARGTAGPAWSLGLGAMPWARAGVSQTVRAGMGAVASGGACKWCLDRSRTALQAAAPPRSAAPHARARAPSGARRRRAPPSSPCSVRMHLERAAACPAGELRAHALRSDPGRGGEAAGPQYTVQQHLLLQRAGACPKAQGTGCTGGVARQGGAALARETSACAAATGRGRAAACMPGHCLCAGLGEQASHALP